MKQITLSDWLHLIEVRLDLLVVLSCVVFTLQGQTVASSVGWVTCPPGRVILLAAGRKAGRGWSRGGKGHGQRAGWCWRGVGQGWQIPWIRSVVLGVLWQASGWRGTGWVVVLPWLGWLWQRGGMIWPGLRGQPEWRAVSWVLWQGQRLVLLGYLGLVVNQALGGEHGAGQAAGVLLGCGVCGRSEPWVEVERPADGSYQVALCGHFQLRVAGADPFRMRLLLLFLRQLEVAGPERVIGRTRDDRAPLVRQVQVAAWFGVPQPNVSRWEGYWLAGNWPDLLSVKTVEVLTLEVRERVVAVWAAFPWWGLAEVHHYLHGQGETISLSQVRQAAQESGWTRLRQELQRRYQLTAESFRPRDGWLVSHLLQMNAHLLTQVESGGGLTREEQFSQQDAQTLAAECGLAAPPPLKALPWLLRVEQVLFGEWQTVTDDTVCCIYCGSTQVARKSNRPRPKRYYDEAGQVQTVVVYRYYCRNPLCAKGSFTHLPSGLVPYSPYRTQTKLLALQMYAWGYSTYRRTGPAVGVTSMTVYRWVSAWGYDLLPVAALFGVVKSSGVVGVDEKYVLVPKNDKPADKMRRWMYVYLAVDVYTYDLLHIALYAHNNQDTAQIFLLALRAKGYLPRVIVTDLRRDYGGDIARIFPQATHHECIFHALQEVGKTCRKLYGRDYAQSQPQVEELRQAIVAIFQAHTKRTAQKRYEAVLAQRDHYAQQKAETAAIFDFLERHWPKLVNAIESQLIPKTNNTVELVIRRFDQHYQSFCGFNSIETAQTFLAVFEKVYRFTPFSDDAQPAIRGKSPLQLAGYDISQMPMTTICQGLSPQWPTGVMTNDVPK